MINGCRLVDKNNEILNTEQWTYVKTKQNNYELAAKSLCKLGSNIR